MAFFGWNEISALAVRLLVLNAIGRFEIGFAWKKRDFWVGLWVAVVTVAFEVSSDRIMSFLAPFFYGPVVAWLLGRYASLKKSSRWLFERMVGSGVGAGLSRLW